MIETKTTAEYVIPCPRCGEKHIFREAYVDRMIDCECGFGCYAFAVDDFRIIMSKSEAENEAVVRSMRRFVVSTGRCADMPPELYLDADELHQRRSNVGSIYIRDHDLEDEIERVLEEYQVEAFGECLLTKELLDSICESLSEDKDIELKAKKDGIEIIELKKKKLKVSSKISTALSSQRAGGIAVFRRSAIDPSRYPEILTGGIMKTDVQPGDSSLKV